MDHLESIKDVARAIWRKYPKDGGYVDEKLARVDDETSALSLYQMFDGSNKAKFVRAIIALNLRLPSELAEYMAEEDAAIGCPWNRSRAADEA